MGMSLELVDNYNVPFLNSFESSVSGFLSLVNDKKYILAIFLETE